MPAFIIHFRRPFTGLLLLAGSFAASLPLAASAQTEVEGPLFYVREYRVTGSTKLNSLEIQETVYPYLGPARTANDVEKARLALEAAFRAKGFDSIAVLIPQQDPRYGVIRLEVSEGKVGRVRVNGAKWFLPSRIKEQVPSLAEGSVPDFNQVRKEMLALNGSSDRTVTPKLRQGVEPGTLDIDLDVEDKLPLHGSLELNNRYSLDTSHLRLSGELSYGNFFQRGHTGSFNFQVAPENPDDALTYSASYQARVNESLSLTLQGSKQDSDVSTIGGSSAVVGAGETLGLRALFDLPYGNGFNQSFTLGIDWKRLDDVTYIFGNPNAAPVEYFPLSASYAATLEKKDRFTEFNLTATLNLRGLGSDDNEFGQKRYYSRGSFIYLRGDVTHTIDFKDDSQFYGKIQGQLSSGALINSEQLSGGGVGSVRGYLEASALGDNGIFATVEYRSPSFIGVEDKNGKRADEWRLHAFLEGGVLGIYDALPGQDSTSTLASAGFGTRFKWATHFNGSVDLAFPLLDLGTTDAFDPFLSFRGWADF